MRRCYSSHRRREIVAVNEYVIWLMHFVTRCDRTKRTEANLSLLHFNVNALRTGLNEKFRKLDELLKFNSWRLDCEIETLACVCPPAARRGWPRWTEQCVRNAPNAACSKGDFMKSDWKLIMSSLFFFCFVPINRHSPLFDLVSAAVPYGRSRSLPKRRKNRQKLTKRKITNRC